MAMRAAWKGSISLGIVQVPIKIYTTTDDKSISFNQLHRDCETAIKQSKNCPTCNMTDLGMGDIVKGFTLDGNKENCVVFTEDDLEQLPVPSIKEIDLVSTGEIPDPITIDTNYFVVPEESGKRAFSVLVAAMTSLKKKGALNGLIAMRNRERPCSIWLREDTVILSTLKFKDEVRHVPVELMKTSKDEVDLALQILSLKNDPMPEEDHYRNAVIEIARKKREGEDWKIPVTKKDISPPTDLMDALRESLKKAGKKNENNL